MAFIDHVLNFAPLKKWKHNWQESIPVGCVPSVFLISGWQGSPYRYPSLPRQWTETPGRNMGPGTETLPPRELRQAARQEVTSYKDIPCEQNN